MIRGSAIESKTRQKSTSGAKGEEKKGKENRNMPTPQAPTVVRSVVKR
jgi:hypothetical protein